MLSNSNVFGTTHSDIPPKRKPLIEPESILDENTRLELENLRKNLMSSETSDTEKTKTRN